jgi:hypothetical protein
MMPPTPTPHLIRSHAQVLLPVLKTSLDRPAHPAHPHQHCQRGCGGSIAQICLHLACSDVVAQYQPDVRPGQALTHSDHPHLGKAGHQGPLAPFLDRPSPPALCRQPGRQLRDRDGLGGLFRDAEAWRGTSLARPGGEYRGRALLPDSGIVGYLGKVPQTNRRDPVQQVRITPKGFITSTPSDSARSPLAARLGSSPTPASVWW